MNYCNRNIEDRLKKEQDDLHLLILYLIYLIKENGCCKKVDGGVF